MTDEKEKKTRAREEGEGRIFFSPK